MEIIQKIIKQKKKLNAVQTPTGTTYTIIADTSAIYNIKIGIVSEVTDFGFFDAIEI